MDAGAKLLTSGEVRVIPHVAELTRVADVDAMWANASTLVLDTETRNLDLEEVADRLALACELASVDPEPLVFKKVDSTLRGHVGAEIEQIIRTTRISFACLAPASPEQGRIVRDGICYHHGVPLAESEIANDPVRPVRSSAVDELVSEQLSRPTALIPLRTVRAGVDELERALRHDADRGMQVVIPDAETDSDLATIAQAFLALNERVLLAGSAGLAKALSTTGLGPVDDDTPGSGTTLSVPGQTLTVIGSVMPTTSDQLRRFQRQYPAAATIAFSGPAIANDPEDETRRLRELCKSRFVSGKPWVLATDPIALAADAGAEIAAALAKLVAEIVVQRDINTLVLSGGDTAHHIVRELDVGWVSLLGEISAGIAVGTCRSRFANRDIQLITKGGGFGGPDALVSVMEFLQTQGAK